MRHDWKTIKWQPGWKEQKCKRCGAERHDSNMYTKVAGGWSRATLNGKKQPYCPIK